MPPSGTIEKLKAEDFAKYPEFAEIPAKDWERLLGFFDEAITLRRFKPGERLCTEGEYVYTAFYILSGRAKIFLSAPMGHISTIGIANAVQHSRTLSGLSRTFNSKTMMSMLDVSSTTARADGMSRTMIPVDASVDLDLESRQAMLQAGDLIGEMSCLDLYPRSATVEALEEVVAFEMHRNVLEHLKKKKGKFKELIERTYRERALVTHMRNTDEFRDLPDAYLDRLKNKVELKSYEPGDVIATEGNAADSFYLIRIGFVQVSKKYPGGDLVLSYMSRGQHFGEVALLTHRPNSETYKALDHVELVRIDKEEFQYMLQTFEAVRSRIKTKARERAYEEPNALPQTIELRLNQLVKQGLMDAQNVLMIDLDKCTRCDECVHACAEAHDGVTRLIRDGLRYENYLVATSCRQCTDPMCMIGCPVGSIRRRESLEVIIEDWCIGCDKCAKNCPYGNISMHEFDVQSLSKVYEGQKQIEREDASGRKRAYIKKATTCDLCTDLEEPSCVYACPHDAAIRGDPNTIVKQRDRQKKSSGIFISLNKLNLPGSGGGWRNWLSWPKKKTPTPSKPSPPAKKVSERWQKLS